MEKTSKNKTFQLYQDLPFSVFSAANTIEYAFQPQFANTFVVSPQRLYK